MTVETVPDTGARPARDRRLAAIVAWGPAVVALVALVVSGRAGAVWQAILHAHPTPLLLLVAAGLALPVVHAARWRAMLRAVAADLPLGDAVEMTITASLVNYALPGYTGSPAKGLLARQVHRIGFGQSTPTLVAEQLLDALALAASAAVAGLLTGRAVLTRVGAAGRSGFVPIVVAAGAVGLCAGLAVVLILRSRSRFARDVVASTRLLATDRGQRGTIAALTVVYWLLGVLGVWAVTRAVGISLGGTALLWLASAPVLLGMLSPLPGGLGLREAAMAAVGGMLGLPVSGIVAAAVLQRGVLVAALPVALAGVRVFRRRPRW